MVTSSTFCCGSGVRVKAPARPRQAQAAPPSTTTISVAARTRPHPRGAGGRGAACGRRVDGGRLNTIPERRMTRRRRGEARSYTQASPPGHHGGQWSEAVSRSAPSMSRRKGRAAAPPRAAGPLPGSAAGPSPVLIAFGLTALNLVVYLQARTFGFVNWDDPSYITENPNVAAGLTWHSAWWALTTGYSPYWHPLTWLSHLLDIQVFGMDAGWHH